MTKPDLTQFDLSELHDEIKRRRKAMIDERTAKLRSLSTFVRQHAEMMKLFFEVGGCKRPEEAVCSLIFEDYEEPKSVPVAYTHSLEHKGDEYDGFGRW